MIKKIMLSSLCILSISFAGIKSIPENFKFVEQDDSKDRIITSYFIPKNEMKDTWSSRISDTTYMLMSKVTPKMYVDTYIKNIKQECEKPEVKIAYDLKDYDQTPMIMKVFCQTPKIKNDKQSFSIFRIWKEDKDLRILEWTKRGDILQSTKDFNFELNYLLQEKPLMLEVPKITDEENKKIDTI